MIEHLESQSNHKNKWSLPSPSKVNSSEYCLAKRLHTQQHLLKLTDEIHKTCDTLDASQSHYAT